MIGVLSACAFETVEPVARPMSLTCPDGLTLRDLRPTEGVMVCEADGERAALWVRTWPNGSEASRGRIEDGQILTLEEAWAEDGTPLARLDGDTLVLLDEAGAEAKRIPHHGGHPVRCPGKATGARPPTARQTGCEDPEGRKQGQHTTWYADGAVESVTWYVDDTPHGPFQSFHPDGSPWIIGGFFDGRRHGTWITQPRAEAK